MGRKIGIGVFVLVVGAALLLRQREPAVPAKVEPIAEEQVSTDPTKQHHDTSVRSAAAPHTKAVEQEESTGEVQAARVSATEERVLSMYDDIANALSDEAKSCDALGEDLGASVRARASELSQWAQTQKDLTPEQVAADRDRLLKLAGSRMQRAQEVIRRSMGKCMNNERFQHALRDLSAFGAPS